MDEIGRCVAIVMMVVLEVCDGVAIVVGSEKINQCCGDGDFVT